MNECPGDFNARAPGEPYPAAPQAWLNNVGTVMAMIPGAEAPIGARDEAAASDN